MCVSHHITIWFSQSQCSLAAVYLSSHITAQWWLYNLVKITPPLYIITCNYLKIIPLYIDCPIISDMFLFLYNIAQLFSVNHSFPTHPNILFKSFKHKQTNSSILNILSIFCLATLTNTIINLNIVAQHHIPQNLNEISPIGTNQTFESNYVPSTAFLTTVYIELNSTNLGAKAHFILA